MEIVGRCRRIAERQRFHAVDFHGDDVVEILQAAFDEKELASRDGETVLLEDVRSDDGV